MDIKLKGPMDGIEAAAMIQSRYAIPVIYLTAFSDEETLERARPTLPLAYLIKPFVSSDLRAAVELALFGTVYRDGRTAGAMAEYGGAVDGRRRHDRRWPGEGHDAQSGRRAFDRVAAVGCHGQANRRDCGALWMLRIESPSYIRLRALWDGKVVRPGTTPIPVDQSSRG